MSGSKRGEHRGNARKRPAGPAGARRKRKERNRTHETPGEIMYEALGRESRACRDPAVIERRIMVARIINGPSDAVEDITPKQMLLMGMHYHAGAIRDVTNQLDWLSQQPVTKTTAAQCNALEAELERLFDKSRDFARDAAPFLHAKLTAIATSQIIGENQVSVLQLLLDEIDEIERSRPIPIEHKPQTTKTGGST